MSYFSIEFFQSWVDYPIFSIDMVIVVKINITANAWWYIYLKSFKMYCLLMLEGFAQFHGNFVLQRKRTQKRKKFHASLFFGFNQQSLNWSTKTTKPHSILVANSFERSKRYKWIRWRIETNFFFPDRD